MPSTILLVDDHPVFRQGLRHLLEKEKDLKVVGEAGDGQEAIERVRDLSPDIVVMDIAMPNLDGIEATRQILSESPDTRVVALSVHSGKRFIRDMIHAGAAGYILKESIPEEMIQGIRTVLSGDVYLSTAISGIVISEYRELLSKTGPEKDTYPEPFLRTKMHRPPVSADIIPRNRLIELLEQGRHRPMTLISAPAGYGKSVLASQWLETCACPGVWLSLDENDNNLRVFLTYLIETVKNAFPGTTPATRAFLKAANLPPEKILAHNLLNDMEKLDESFILVLDDYQHIREKAIHELLIELLRYPSPMMHLVVLTRRDPPLPISSMRAGGQLTEITMEDLRFTLSETTAFLDRFLHVSPDENTASALNEKVEGWVAGLRLAALSMGQKGDRDPIVEGLGEGVQFVHEYLMQEVLSQVPPAFASLLIETSILDRFCAPLCDALHMSEGRPVEDEAGGQAFIEWLEKTHLFVVPLDETHIWFRYHHLFQQLLQNQLEDRYGPQEVATLHSRAGSWCAENGLIREAIQHDLAAGDTAGAVDLFGLKRQSVLNDDKWYVLEKWLRLFPDAIIEKQPELLIARTWVLYHHFQFLSILSALDTIESRLKSETGDRSLYGELYFFSGFCRYFLNDGPKSLEHIQAAIDRIPLTYHEVRGQAELMFGLTCQMEGQKENAIHTLNGLIYGDPPPHNLRKTRLLVSLVYIHIISADPAEAFKANKELMEVATTGDYAYAKAWSIYLQGLIRFYGGEFEDAVHDLSQTLADRYKYVLHTRAAVDSMAGLAFAHQFIGQPDRADATIESLFKFAGELNDPAFSAIAASCRARLLVIQDRIEEAVNMLPANEIPGVENTFVWLEVPTITHCRVLIAEGSDAGLTQAEKRLQESLEMNRDNHNTRAIIEILSLLSLVCKGQGKDAEALSLLKRSLDLARPGEWIQPFIEPGPPMADLLNRLEKRDADDFTGKILTALNESQSQVSTADVPPGHKIPHLQALVEPLTNRELDILELLAERLQTKEIAEKKFISPETVKSHLKNIYQKLGVSNRREAVVKAKSLGIITGDG
jgi:LuxR family maltose regulon positive regulatory protein